ncbi:hypothetical protein F2Q69_00008155 [Brassica cretica]|uniref:Uncharacterized protein n=1 Tax=Brassica cretica TaxID=69181 RepID=A0A8S9PDE4_BRACR|nr:hypothetical protein F2Q69_00008155 [Brassica cretica]
MSIPCLTCVVKAIVAGSVCSSTFRGFRSSYGSSSCLFSVWLQQRYKWWCDDGVVVCDEQNMSIILQKLQGSLHLSISQA